MASKFSKRSTVERLSTKSGYWEVMITVFLKVYDVVSEYSGIYPQNYRVQKEGMIVLVYIAGHSWSQTYAI